MLCSPRLIADGLELRHDAAVGVAQGLQAWRRRKTRDVELLVEADLCTVSVCICHITYIYILIYMYIYIYMYTYVSYVINVSSDDNSMYGIVSLWMNVLLLEIQWNVSLSVALHKAWMWLWSEGLGGCLWGEVRAHNACLFGELTFYSTLVKVWPHFESLAKIDVWICYAWHFCAIFFERCRF